MTKKNLGELLNSNWVTFNKLLRNIKEKDIYIAVKLERSGQNRVTFIARMCSRASELGAQRIKKELGCG